MSVPRLSEATAPESAPMFALPERAVQFGTGAFLRGFIDDYVDAANARGEFNGRIVAIGTTGSGRDRAFADQDGLFTVVSRGVAAGRVVDSAHVVSAVSRALSASDDWHAVLACARNPQLAVIFSNTTEVGIRIDDDADTLHAAPPKSFPAKLTRFLYERARAFAFAPSKGVIVVPCELIEHNGAVLKALVLQLAERWECEPGFGRWIETSVMFVNTLVDRIVPGAPAAADRDALEARLGYSDALLTTAECYRQFAIEGDDGLRARLGFANDASIIITPDIEPYRRRKVQLLNGAHTVMVTTALLAGCTTVRDAMTHAVIGPFIRKTLLDEIVPAVDAPDAALFAHAVLERFENPHIQHALADITMQGTTKLRVRVLPSLLRHVELFGRVPDGIAFGLAAHIAYLRPEALHARRAAGLTMREDDTGEHITRAWAALGNAQLSDENITRLVEELLANVVLWNSELSLIPGLAPVVSTALRTIIAEGSVRALELLHVEPLHPELVA